MSKITSFGYTDTAPAGGATKALTRPNLNYSVNFAKNEDSDRKAVITNRTSPIDQQETFRFQLTDVSNIYTGTSVDPSVFATSKAGVSVVSQVNDILRVTDSVDPSYQVDLPMSVHMVIKMPKSQFITSANIETVVARCVASLYDTDSTGVSRIEALVRGSMLPSTM